MLSKHAIRLFLLLNTFHSIVVRNSYPLAKNRTTYLPILTVLSVPEKYTWNCKGVFAAVFVLNAVECMAVLSSSGIFHKIPSLSTGFSTGAEALHPSPALGKQEYFRIRNQNLEFTVRFCFRNLKFQKTNFQCA